MVEWLYPYGSVVIYRNLSEKEVDKLIVGRYNVAVDSQGRLIVPSSWHPDLGEEVVIIRDLSASGEHFLTALTKEAYNGLINDFGHNPPPISATQTFQGAYCSTPAAAGSIRSAGSPLIPITSPTPEYPAAPCSRRTSGPTTPFLRSGSPPLLSGTIRLTMSFSSRRICRRTPKRSGT